jgi:nitroreductase
MKYWQQPARCERGWASRPLGQVVIEECLTIAQQASTGSNLQNWHLVVVTDRSKSLTRD